MELQKKWNLTLILMYSLDNIGYEIKFKMLLVELMYDVQKLYSECGLNPYVLAYVRINDSSCFLSLHSLTIKTQHRHNQQDGNKKKLLGKNEETKCCPEYIDMGT